MRSTCSSTSFSLMVEWTCREASSSACNRATCCCRSIVSPPPGSCTPAAIAPSVEFHSSTAEGGLAAGKMARFDEQSPNYRLSAKVPGDRDCAVFRSTGPNRLIKLSSYLLDATNPNRLWFHQFRERNWLSLNGLLRQSIEQFAACRRGAAVEAECELVEIIVQVLGRHCALVCSHQPAFQ